MNAARAGLVALLMCWAIAAFADVAVPPLSGRVVDQTGTLSSDDIARLTQTLKDLEQRKGSQVAVLIVPTTQPETIEQYSIRVAEAWKIGRKKIDDGALLVVAKNDRKLRIEVGYGLEGALNDITAKRIIDEIITPPFRNGDFSGGISAGVNQIIRVIDGEKLPAPRPAPQQSFRGLDDVNPGFALVGTVILAGIMRAMLGRLLGAGVTGGVVGLLAWFVVGSLVPSLLAAIIVFIVALVVDLSSPQGRSGGSGWSGGSSSGGGDWSSGSSSSDSGSFSGGGGSFGGGGASGSW
jgi:uncharacterized protein